MKLTKKLISLLLAAVLMAVALPLAAASAEDGFIVNDSGILISYKGGGGNISIPSYVTGIDDNVFRDDKTITGVTVGPHVKHIGRHAFDGCINLETASISSEFIAYAAFLDCKNLTTLTLGSEVKGLAEYAFYNCEKLAAVTIPEGITAIPGNCFYGNSSLAVVIFPKTLKAVEESAFVGIAVKEVYFYPGLETIEDSAFALTDSLTDIWIPETVSKLEYHAFTHNSAIDSTIHGVADSYAEGVLKNDSKYTFVPDYYGGYDPGDPADPGDPDDPVDPVDPVDPGDPDDPGIPDDPDDPIDPVDPGDPDDPGDDNGEIGQCRDVKYDDTQGSAIINSDGTISIYPAEGHQVDTITVNGEKISFTTDISGWTIISGIRTTDKVVIEFGAPAPMTFTDVPPGSYYADAVDWAVENKITSGTSTNTFSPNTPCTRAEAVTFLWRAAGSPEPKGDTAFDDVKPGSYYDKAVRWAVERSITSGVGDGRFDPDGKCTRGQIVTFLWRFHGGAEQVPTVTFQDVNKDAYYYSAVLWAAKHDITSGVGGDRFDPDGQCTRSQIVTFLYRDPFSFVC